MSISAISGNNPYSGLQSLFSQPNQDLQALATDLNSGNLAGAQKDFASLQQDVTSSFSSLLGSNATIPASNAGTGPTADLQALQNALKSNDLAGAQKSFAAFQQDVRGFGMHRGHRRHHHSDSDGDAQPNGTSNATGANAISNSDNGVPDFTMAAMLAAYRAFGTNGLAGATNTLSVVA
jgi:hypothetical protein